MKPSKKQYIAYFLIITVLLVGFFLYKSSKDKYSNISHAEINRIGDTYTGVYHRPACPQAQDIQSGVIEFENNKAAQSAGYHACKHCKPNAD